MNAWFYCPAMEKIEFTGNSVVAGADMGDYDYSEMNMPLFYKSLIEIGGTSVRCSDYLVKDFYADVPFLWGIYSCSFLYLKFAEAGSFGDYERYGYNRSSKRNIIDNIFIKLGEGPDIDKISNNDLSRINAWFSDNNNVALDIEGVWTYRDARYYEYCNQANTALNISVSNPWGTAVYVNSLYAEFDSIRGAIKSGEGCYIKVKNMTVKKAFPGTFYIGRYSQYIEVDNLLIEETGNSECVSFQGGSDNRFNFRLVINKSNYPAAFNNSAISQNINYYNESMIIQKDIGEEHIFMAKSLNKFIESCSVQYNGINSLKMYGMYDHNRSLKIIDTGESGLTSRRLAPGRYRLRINMAFYGDDLVENTVENPSSDRRNVLNLSNLVIGIKTENGAYSVPDECALGCEGIWSSDMVTPFHQDYYIDIVQTLTIHINLKLL